MRLRVKHYTGEKWVIQRRRFFVWITITRAFLWHGSNKKLMSSRRFPWMFETHAAAVEQARQLMKPGALAEHEAQQDRVWESAKVEIADEIRDHERVTVLG